MTLKNAAAPAVVLNDPDEWRCEECGTSRRARAEGTDLCIRCNGDMDQPDPYAVRTLMIGGREVVFLKGIGDKDVNPDYEAPGELTEDARALLRERQEYRKRSREAWGDA